MVVLCAANNWDDVRLADRPLAEELVHHAPVLYVDPPLSHLGPRHNPRVRPALERPRLREVQPGLVRLTPVVPPRPFRRSVLPLTRRVVRHRIRQAVAELGGEVRAVVSTMLLVDVFDLAPEASHLYWMQDDVATGALHWGMDGATLLRGERRVAAAADAILAASPLAAQRWRSAGHTVHDLPNGCDVSRFLAPAPGKSRIEVDLPGPVAGFVGHLNERTDLDLLAAVLDEGMSLLLVGPVSSDLDGARLSRILAHPRARAVGPQPFEDLPLWMESVDVGLVPYRTDDFNRYSFPLKTLEYLAAGLPVVSTGLPANDWLGSPDIVEADTPEPFARAARKAVISCADPRLVERRRTFAATHTWARRAETLAGILDLRT
ncbi:glycosyltransferase [Ornithinimicrobium kibberense]|uniref:Glycosyltransferase n=1 Tax=Ornithinimicrobium kibberense TaxID=282060 RepID=A0ABV5V6F1_9MICO|nr:glycosyltransferase [Ornithinimicrobium kibberense]